MPTRKVRAKGRFVIAYDGSRGSRRALDVGVAMARGTRVPVEVAVVEDLDAAARVFRRSPDFAAAMAKVHQGAESLAIRARTRATRAGVEAYHSVLRGDDAAVAIVRRAEVAGATAIVVGSRGRSQLRRLALGSVAERVAQLAHCTVVIVR